MQIATGEAAAPRTPAMLVKAATALVRRGEAARALPPLLSLPPETIRSAEVALRAGGLCLWLHRLPEAAAFLRRAAVLAPADPQVRAARAECRALRMRPEIWRTAGDVLRAQLQRLAQPPRAATPPEHVHIVCKLDTLGGSERRALNLYRSLRPHVPTTLWSTLPASSAIAEPVRLITAGAVPQGGTLVMSGTYYRCGEWLRTARFERVVICHNLSEQYANLGYRLSRLEANLSRPRVALTFPSRMFRDLTGLPGAVEYSPVDTSVFCPRVPRAPERKLLCIGRHGRAWSFKFHPNDPALFRALLARGHRIRILGGSAIAPAFVQDRGALPELLEAGALDAASFLDGLDVFLYRKHPQFVETGGTVILEAMAMALPVVVFGEDCGHAELIEDGRNGFLVSSEAEACARIDALHADPALRVRLGDAARATILELIHRQQRELLDFYLERRTAQ